MTNVYAGVDPGKTGAVAFIRDNNISIYDFGDYKIIQDLIEYKKKGDIRAVLEKVHAMPGQGVSSMFTFGSFYGWWLGVLDALGVPYHLIPPQKWQGVMFDFKPIKGKRTAAEWARFRKQLSLERARRLYPQAREFLTRKKDHNRADALLIAGYCKILSWGEK